MKNKTKKVMGLQYFKRSWSQFIMDHFAPSWLITVNKLFCAFVGLGLWSTPTVMESVTGRCEGFWDKGSYQWSQMKNFDIFYAICLGEVLLKQRDNFNKTLQKCDISAAEGQMVASMTMKTFNILQTFWEKVCKQVENLGISQPTLPRRYKVKQQFKDGEAEGSYPATPEDHYRHIFFEALDLIVTNISNWFDQPGFKVYHNIQELVLKAVQGKNYQAELDFVIDFYGTILKVIYWKLNIKFSLPTISTITAQKLIFLT